MPQSATNAPIDSPDIVLAAWVIKRIKIADRDKRFLPESWRATAPFARCRTRDAAVRALP
jgi:hypothetical protein